MTPMEPQNLRTDLPVLFFNGFDHTWPEDELEDYSFTKITLINALIEVGHPVVDVCLTNPDIPSALAEYNPDDYVVFNLCEEVPEIPHSEHLVGYQLEELGFTFTGSGSHSLSLCQDKRRIKQFLRNAGISTPDWQVYTDTGNVSWAKFPAIVKLALEHCSTGITRRSVVQSQAELVSQLEYTFQEYKQPALVEEFIDGREIRVGVIGNGKLKMLPPAEIDYSPLPDIHDHLCTYESNYDRTSLAYRMTVPRLPASLDDDQLFQLEKVVTTACRVGKCRDYARLDLRLNGGEFFVLDVNPNPDLSPETSFVRAAKSIGLPYGQLASLLVNLAAQRHPVFQSWFPFGDHG